MSNYRMFVEACQRLRLMKSSEVVNLGMCYHHLRNLGFAELSATVTCVVQLSFARTESNSLLPLQRQELLNEAHP